MRGNEKIFENHLNTDCHVGSPWTTLSVKHSKMSTHVPGLQSHFNFLHHFVTAKLATSSMWVNKKIHENHQNTDCYVGTPWIALVEYSQMSTHVPGFQSHFRVLHQFVTA